MKKLTQLIKESLINYDFIEDVMVHLEDMGFKIVIFNDIGGYKGKRNNLFASDKPEFNLYSFSPREGVNNYPCYIISLEKQFKPFEDDGSVYAGVVQNVELIKRRLKGCYVSYSMITKCENGDWANGDAKLTLNFYIVDKSAKLEPKLVQTLKDMETFIKDLIHNKHRKISMIYSITFKNDSIVLRVGDKSDSYKSAKELIEDVVLKIESECKSKWNLQTKTYESEETFLSGPYESYYLELKPIL
jgi:hypothetical protein